MGMVGAAAGVGVKGCGKGAVVEVTSRASGLNGRSGSANSRFVDRLGVHCLPGLLCRLPSIQGSQCRCSRGEGIHRFGAVSGGPQCGS